MLNFLQVSSTHFSVQRHIQRKVIVLPLPTCRPLTFVHTLPVQAYVSTGHFRIWILHLHIEHNGSVRSPPVCNFLPFKAVWNVLMA